MFLCEVMILPLKTNSVSSVLYIFTLGANNCGRGCMLLSAFTGARERTEWIIRKEEIWIVNRIVWGKGET